MNHRKNGFTLLELLAVILILAIMTSIVVGSSQLGRYRVKSEAQQLASLLRSARQYALENSAHTRVVFCDADLEEFTEGKFIAGESYGAYAFFKPTLPSGGSDYKPFTVENEYAPEFASMPFTSIPSGFVGQFIPLPGSESWRRLSPRVTILGFVPEDSEMDSGFNRDFFDPGNPVAEAEEDIDNPRSEQFVSRFFYNPANYWDSDGEAYYLPNVANSQYPQNYYQTPYPFAYPLIATRVMPDEPSNFTVSGSALSYRDLWSGQAELEYFHEIEEHAGSYKKLGEPDKQSPSSEKKRFFDLKGIEFSPKGFPTLKWADEVVFQFQPKERSGRSTAAYAYDVTVDRNTGLAHVRVAKKLYDPEEQEAAP